MFSRIKLQSKYILENQPQNTEMETKKRCAQLNCWELYKVLKPHVQLILDDETYFPLTGDLSCNRQYYTTDSFTASSEVKYKTKVKFKPKLLVLIAVSQKGVSSTYVHHSAIPVKKKIYLNECIRKQLLPFIKYHHKGDNTLFWRDLASLHYSKQIQDFLMAYQINFVQRQQNPPNVPQARPIETVSSLLEQKVYEGAWKVKNLNQFARRIILKAKQLDENVVIHMILGV